MYFQGQTHASVTRTLHQSSGKSNHHSYICLAKFSPVYHREEKATHPSVHGETLFLITALVLYIKTATLKHKLDTNSYILWHIYFFYSPSICSYVFPPEWSNLFARHHGRRRPAEWWDPLRWFGVCCPHWQRQRSSKVWLDKGRPGELWWVMMGFLCSRLAPHSCDLANGGSLDHLNTAELCGAIKTRVWEELADYQKHQENVL